MRRKGDFSHLKNKLYLNIMVIIMVAGLVIWLLFWLLSGHFGNWFANFLALNFRLSFEDARGIYWAIRSNPFYVILVSILLLIPLTFGVAHWMVNKVVNYIDEIMENLDVLVQDERDEIVLSPELATLEQNMKLLKQTLEKRQLEAKEAEQRKNDLLVYLAHDLKTPLTSVIGYLSLLDEAKDLPSQLREKYVGITLNKANRLEELINEFFEITRFNTNEIVIHRERLNLSYLLWQLADEFYPQLQPLGKEIEIEAEDDLYLWADGDKLARVFNNILRNAVIYSYQNTTILVCAKQVNDEIMITLSNQGDPIPPQKLETIFEKFFRLDQSRSTQTGGAGLGLAIAKEIVEAHGGTITAQSNRERTSFTVTIPIGE